MSCEVIYRVSEMVGHPVGCDKRCGTCRYMENEVSPSGREAEKLRGKDIEQMKKFLSGKSRTDGIIYDCS
jgi:hypothetical protein